MKSPDADLSAYLEFIQRLAALSGGIVEKYFRSDALDVQTKDDRSIVTRADREAEELMRTEIQRAFPQHGIIGEEFGNHHPEAEFVWVLDPIDGTISFASGVPLFGTLIGLLQHGKPIVGCIHQPILKLLCVGDNQTTTLNGRPVRIRSCATTEESTLLITDPRAVRGRWNEDAFDQLTRRVRTYRTWGDCFGYLQLACGLADAMLDPVLNPWDLLPVIPVVTGAGGCVSAWDGGDVLSATSCVAAGPELHPHLIRQLTGENE